MLDAIKNVFQELFELDAPADNPQQAKELAAAGLLLEVATIDHQLEEAELSALQSALQSLFSLDNKTLQQLVQLARSNAQDSVSIHPFTRCVNDHFSPEEKFDLLTGMWRVAYADLDLDKYEEYTIRKIADLLYISQSDFIRAKQIARDGH